MTVAGVRSKAVISTHSEVKPCFAHFARTWKTPGRVKLTVENPDSTAEINADVAVLRDEAEIRTIPNADEAVDVQNMTQAQQEQLSAEAAQAFSGVMDFINKKAAPAQ